MLVKETEEKGQEIKCPWCGNWQPRENYKQYTLMPQYMAHLTPILQCQAEREGDVCRHIFAPTELALKMRQDLLAGVQETEQHVND